MGSQPAMSVLPLPHRDMVFDHRRDPQLWRPYSALSPPPPPPPNYFPRHDPYEQQYQHWLQQQQHQHHLEQYQIQLDHRQRWLQQHHFFHYVTPQPHQVVPPLPYPPIYARPIPPPAMEYNPNHPGARSSSHIHIPVVRRPAPGNSNSIGSLSKYIYPEQDDSFDTDSAYDGGADLESATTSLRSAITDFHYENGRRYHAYRAGAYWGPNDALMADTHDIGHHIFTIMMDGKLHLAPVEKPRRALDVGTGTGIWAIDFADAFPDCQVIGTDLSPTQPQEVPPNLQFEVDDACSEWVYTKGSFDYIHVRGMYGSVSDWPAFYNEVMKHLKPGGWFEQLELGVSLKSDDGTVPQDSIFDKWGKISLAAGDAFGKSLRTVDESKQGLIQAGFVDVQESRYKLPVGGWSKDRRLKELGMYNRLYWEQGLEGWCMFLLTRYLGWQYEEVMVYVAEMRKMLRDKSVHAYHDGSVVIGRKPFN